MFLQKVEKTRKTWPFCVDDLQPLNTNGWWCKTSAANQIAAFAKVSYSRVRTNIWQRLKYRCHTLANSSFLVRDLTISSYECLWGCSWSYKCPNHVNLFACSNRASSPSFSSSSPCLKLRPENPRLNLNPGIFCDSLSWTDIISWMKKKVTTRSRILKTLASRFHVCCFAIRVNLLHP